MKKIKQFVTVLTLLISGVLNAQMVLEYDIIEVNTEIAIPLGGALIGTIDVIIDWGDGTADESFTSSGNKPHTYTTTGIKTVTVSGVLTTAYGSPANDDGNTRLKRVLRWDNLGVTDLSYAFSGASILEEVPSTLPIGVVDLSYMFDEASIFNQDISSWDVSNVMDMRSMFNKATAFNQPLDSWEVGEVTSMEWMFYGSEAFNQPLASWDVRNVVDMFGMFESSGFNQDIGSWDISNVKDMAQMFNNVTLCTENYDRILNGWASQEVLSDIEFNGGESQFSSAGVESRDLLISKGWSISDWGKTNNVSPCITAVSNDYVSDIDLEFFPNPAQEHLQINFVSQTFGDINFDVYDLTGRLITSQSRSLSLSETSVVDIDDLESGNYLLKITTVEGVRSVSFVKE